MNHKKKCIVMLIGGMFALPVSGWSQMNEAGMPATPGPAVSQYPMQPVPSGEGMMPYGQPGAMPRDLMIMSMQADLTEEQRKRIEAIDKRVRQMQWETMSAIGKKQEEIRKIQEQARKDREEMRKMRQQMIEEHQKAFEEARKIIEKKSADIAKRSALKKPPEPVAAPAIPSPPPAPKPMAAPAMPEHMGMPPMPEHMNAPPMPEHMSAPAMPEHMGIQAMPDQMSPPQSFWQTPGVPPAYRQMPAAPQTSKAPE